MRMERAGLWAQRANRRWTTTGLLAGLAVTVMPGWTAGQSPASGMAKAKPAFAVVSVKLSRPDEADDWGMGIRGRNFWATYVRAEELIEWAYGVSARQIEHAPEWLSREHFDLEGVPEPGPVPTREQYRVLLQTALADRFGLQFHAGSKVLPVYVLSVEPGGVKMAKTEEATGSTWGIHRGWFSVKNMTFGDTARVMQRTVFERPVLDQTGLADRYSFVLTWRAEEGQFTRMQGMDVPQESGTEDVDDLFTAARKQLGLRIESKKAPVTTMVVDAVVPPAPN